MSNAGRGAVAIIVSPFEKPASDIGCATWTGDLGGNLCREFCYREIGKSREGVPYTRGSSKNMGFAGIDSDILVLMNFSILLVSQSVAIFRRQI